MIINLKKIDILFLLIIIGFILTSVLIKYLIGGESGLMYLVIGLGILFFLIFVQLIRSNQKYLEKNDVATQAINERLFFLSKSHKLLEQKYKKIESELNSTNRKIEKSIESDSRRMNIIIKQIQNLSQENTRRYDDISENINLLISNDIKQYELTSDTSKVIREIERDIFDNLDKINKSIKFLREESDIQSNSLNKDNKQIINEIEGWRNKTDNLGIDIISKIVVFQSAVEKHIQSSISSVHKEIEVFTNNITKAVVNTGEENSQQIKKMQVTQVNHIYSQLDSLLNFLSNVNNIHPFPVMRGWAISPDVANYLYSTVVKRKPTSIISLGSGVSDLVIGYALKKNGFGKLYSFEHEREFVEISKDNVNKHELEEYIEILYSPLKEISLESEAFSWYDIDTNKIPDSIDILFVDGPPGNIGNLARYPAIPLLHSKFSEDIIIILDDGRRKDEKEIVKRWCESDEQYKSKYLFMEKGLFVITR